ncbi:hypothetical protein Y032_0211g2198 [Ancylostoma ceylanicum]|uniref:RING-type domain-containing protein n=1 Tax=Ancylostoma ceylanicum TaxID=53326 RepID=A0A016SKB4_9BILA|nr:hypothetical protein Y032_0211g2198 [Ancylostoma ceylanicum]
MYINKRFLVVDINSQTGVIYFSNSTTAGSMSTCINKRSGGTKRKGSNLNLTKFYDDVDIHDHLPNFVSRSAKVQLRGMGFCCGDEEGRQIFKFNIRWTDPSSDTKEKWQEINKSIKNRNTSESLTDLHFCDGPCRGIYNNSKMMKYPDCSHVICAQCRYEQVSVPNADGTPGCCVEKCYRESLINRVPNAEYRQVASEKSNPFMGVTYSPKPSQKPSHQTRMVSRAKCYTPNALVPTELLQIRVVILEKPTRTIVRSKIEFELPSDFPLDYILDVVEEKLQYLDGIQIYYTTEPIRSRKSLIPITIIPNDNRTIGNIAKGRSMVNFVVATPGIRMFREKPTAEEPQQAVTAPS